jgi:hypothetical protein
MKIQGAQSFGMLYLYPIRQLLAGIGGGSTKEALVTRRAFSKKWKKVAVTGAAVT